VNEGAPGPAPDVGACRVPANGSPSQDTILWRAVGQWQIRVDKSLGYGCFLIGSYTRGTVLRIGIDQQNGNSYVLVGNEAWRSLQVGNQYDLALRMIVPTATSCERLTWRTVGR
jgi:hypothetical protein